MTEREIILEPAVSETTSGVTVDVRNGFVGQAEDKGNYLFVYLIKISNNRPDAVQLIDRHWIITDLNMEISHVKGEGVVGEQPVIAPGDTYTYSSQTLLRSPTGSMSGSYGMMNLKTEEPFDVVIPEFQLYAVSCIN